MFGHETRPSHFFIPAIFVIVGGLFARMDGFEFIGWSVWGIGGLSAFFLIYTAIKDKQLDRIREEHEHYAQIITLDAAKTKTKVVIDKTAIVGNALSQTFAELRIPPTKMKIFATKVLNGTPLVIREWTPIKDGKTFSDGEWRRLIEFMKRPAKDEPRIKFIEQINPNEERKGYRLTDAGRKWLENIAEAYALAPVSA